jgi:hypothetical protein
VYWAGAAAIGYDRRRLVRKILGLFSSAGDQQEQPFVQVNADRSIWIK